MKPTKFTRRILLLALTAVISAAGCGFSIERVTPAVERPRELPHFGSPQAAYSALMAAARQKDFPAVLDCFTDKTAEELAGLLLYVGGTTKKVAYLSMLTGAPNAEQLQMAVEAIDGVFDEHQITDRTLKNLPASSPELFADSHAMREMGARLRKQRSFAADMLTMLNKIQPDAAPVSIFEGKLVDVKINGDQAAGAVVGADRQEKITFQKTEDGWFIDFEIDAFLRKQPSSAKEGMELIEE